MGSVSKKFYSFLLVTFVLWYLLRRTNLGRSYTRDMFQLPGLLGAGEGLGSARGH